MATTSMYLSIYVYVECSSLFFSPLYRCMAMFTEALCLTQAPPCNPNLTFPAANFLRLCSNQRCFDYYRQFVNECSSVDVNLTMYLPATASQALFCPGYFGGVCKEAPGEYLSFAVKCCVSCNMVCQCYFCVRGCNPANKNAANSM